MDQQTEHELVTLSEQDSVNWSRKRDNEYSVACLRLVGRLLSIDQELLKHENLRKSELVLMTPSGETSFTIHTVCVSDLGVNVGDLHLPTQIIDMHVGCFSAPELGLRGYSLPVGDYEFPGGLVLVSLYKDFTFPRSLAHRLPEFFHELVHVVDSINLSDVMLRREEAWHDRPTLRAVMPHEINASVIESTMSLLCSLSGTTDMGKLNLEELLRHSHDVESLKHPSLSRNAHRAFLLGGQIMTQVTAFTRGYIR
jgi:hypothetical protein